MIPVRWTARGEAIRRTPFRNLRLISVLQVVLRAWNRFEIDKVIASGVDQAVSHKMESENDYWERHSLNFDEIAQAVDTAVPVSEIIPYIKTLEAAYWEYYPQKDSDKDAKDCVLAVLYYLWHKKYTNWDFNITLTRDTKFQDHVDKEYERLAAGISAYLELRDLPFLEIKPEWYTWAGDLATAFLEIDALKEDPAFQNEITHARDRIGRMEVTDAVQMNYCDIFGDADAYAIYTIVADLLQNSTDKRYILSSAFELYYSDPENSSYCHYTKRFSHFLNHLPITYYKIGSMTDMLYDYFVDDEQYLLLQAKAKMENDKDEDLAVIRACCRAFAELIMHYFDASN